MSNYHTVRITSTKYEWLKIKAKEEGSTVHSVVHDLITEKQVSSHNNDAARYSMFADMVTAANHVPPSPKPDPKNNHIPPSPEKKPIPYTPTRDVSSDDPSFSLELRDFLASDDERRLQELTMDDYSHNELLQEKVRWLNDGYRGDGMDYGIHRAMMFVIDDLESSNAVDEMSEKAVRGHESMKRQYNNWRMRTRGDKFRAKRKL